MNPSSGTFNWTVMDAYAAINVPILFTVFQTPFWAAKVADQAFTGPYGNLGECGAPNNLADLGNFITALMTRYNSGPTKTIRILEVWNEPNFYQNHTGFFWGSASDLVDMVATVRTAALAVDPTVKVIGPGFILTSAIGSFLNTQGPVSGKYGREVIDGFSFHPYYAEGIYQQLLNPGNPLSTRMGDVTSALAAAGIPNMPVYMTEYGTGVSATDNAVTAFNALPAAQRKTWMKRFLAISAGMGIKHVSLYAYSSPTNSLCGDLTADTTGVIAAMSEVSAVISGATITNMTQTQDGTLSFTASGVSYVW